MDQFALMSYIVKNKDNTKSKKRYGMHSTSSTTDNINVTKRQIIKLLQDRFEVRNVENPAKELKKYLVEKRDHLRLTRNPYYSEATFSDIKLEKIYSY